MIAMTRASREIIISAYGIDHPLPADSVNCPRFMRNQFAIL